MKEFYLFKKILCWKYFVCRKNNENNFHKMFSSMLSLFNKGKSDKVSSRINESQK